MFEAVYSLPTGALFAVLWVAAFVRGAITYGLGRGLRAGGERTSMARRLDGPMVRAAERWLGRFGPLLVSVGFLTVGVQSAINLAAGAMRMPPRRYGPALALGATLWAGLYTVVGFAAAQVMLGRGSWWVLALALGLVVASVVGSRLIESRSDAC